MIIMIINDGCDTLTDPSPENVGLKVDDTIGSQLPLVLQSRFYSKL